MTGREETARELIEDCRELLSYIDTYAIQKYGLDAYPDKLRRFLLDLLAQEQWLRDRISKDRLI
jgi:hypothetical protein